MLYTKTKSLLYTFYLATAMTVSANDHLERVFWTPHLRSEFSSFLNEVLRQVKSKDFYKVVDSCKTNGQGLSDAELYKLLIKRRGELSPQVQLFKQHKSLKHQKKVMVTQAAQLIGADSEIDGYVEIGTPGTFMSSIKTKMKVTGDFYVINDKQRMSDYFKAFSFNPIKGFSPYDHFVPLNNYDPINEIPANSVDLVTCFIGLHHVPQDKLEPFVASIFRILRPGGILLIREHDCRNTDIESLTQAAHSVTNAIMLHEPLEVELHEYRNFQKLEFWLDIIQRCGFLVSPQRLIQAGDPTLNTMIKCTKVAQTQEDHLLKISRELKLKKNYEYPLARTYLNNPEWFDADATHEYNDFTEHAPFYEFPHLKYIKSYWKTFGKSYQLASRKVGHFKTIASFDLMKNIFIGLGISAKHTAQAAISAPISWIHSTKKAKTVQTIIKDPKNEINTLGIQFSVLKVYLGPDLQLIELTRNEFLKLITAITSTDISILEIAGQHELQLDVRYHKTNNAQIFDSIRGCKKEYEWNSLTNKDCSHAILTVQISDLKKIITYLKSHNVEILHV